MIVSCVIEGRWWGTAKTYKEEHLGLEHHSDCARRGDGRSAGRYSQTELDVPLQLASLVRELHGGRDVGGVRCTQTFEMCYLLTFPAECPGIDQQHHIY